MRRLFSFLIFGIAGLLVLSVLFSDTSDNTILGAPITSPQVSLIPITDSLYDLGTTTRAWRNAYIDQICLTADTCKTAWPTGGGGGSGNVATSTTESRGLLAYWTSEGATPATLGEVATSSITVSSPLTSAGTPGAVVGGSGWTLDVATTTNSLFTGGAAAGYVLGWDGTNWTAMATATCVAITGSAALCDGDDASAAGGGIHDPFSHETNWGSTNSATTSVLWAKSGINASSTSHFDNSTTTLATVSNTLFVGTAVTGDSTQTFGWNPSASAWSIGRDDTDGTFAIASSSVLGTNNALTINNSNLLTTLLGGLTITTGKNFTLGTTQWNNGDDFDADVVSGDANNDDDLDVAAGGTGVSTLTGVVFGNGASDMTAIATSSLYGAAVTAGHVLMSTGAGWTTMATATCVAITGSSALCDGDDATVGSADNPFPAATNFGASRNATTSIVWFQNGLYASSTAEVPTWFNNFRSDFSTTTNATSTFSFATVASSSKLFAGTTQLASLTLLNALGATSGGTGQGAVATGDVLYGSATNVWSRLTAGTNGRVLTMSGGLPAWVATTTAGTGLSYDGTSFAFAAIAANSVLGNITGASAVPSAVATSSLFTFSSAAFTTTGTVRNVIERGFTYPTTTWSGTTTLPLEQSSLAKTIDGVRCSVYTDTKGTKGGTVNVQLGKFTASTTMITASSTNNFNAFSSNNTVTAGDSWYVEMGTPVSSPRFINCTYKMTI